MFLSGLRPRAPALSGLPKSPCLARLYKRTLSFARYDDFCDAIKGFWAELKLRFFPALKGRVTLRQVACRPRRRRVYIQLCITALQGRDLSALLGRHRAIYGVAKIAYASDGRALARSSESLVMRYTRFGHVRNGRGAGAEPRQVYGSENASAFFDNSRVEIQCILSRLIRINPLSFMEIGILVEKKKVSPKAHLK
jgi:hypothetical protein